MKLRSLLLPLCLGAALWTNGGHAAFGQGDKDVPPEMRTPRVDARLEKMRTLIVNGVKAGTLTAGEATSLGNELKRIERRQDTASHNKRVTPKERRQLNRDLNELHERVWKKTHNGTKPEEPLVKE